MNTKLKNKKVIQKKLFPICCCMSKKVFFSFFSAYKNNCHNFRYTSEVLKMFSLNEIAKGHMNTQNTLIQHFITFFLCVCV